MKRNAKIALLAHCLLNVNSKVEGLAEYCGVHPVVTGLIDRGYGLLQLPCPELTALGMKRWAQTIEQYDNPFFRTHCSELAEDVARQVKEYLRCGYTVGPLIGIEGSPCCGVTATSSGEWGGHYDEERMASIRAERQRVDGSGVFIKELAQRLEPLGVRFVAIDEHEEDDGIGRILAEIES